jgi:hypothetical protein
MIGRNLVLRLVLLPAQIWPQKKLSSWLGVKVAAQFLLACKSNNPPWVVKVAAQFLLACKSNNPPWVVLCPKCNPHLAINSLAFSQAINSLATNSKVINHKCSRHLAFNTPNLVTANHLYHNLYLNLKHVLQALVLVADRFAVPKVVLHL